jgi:hypothetical protein
MTFPLHVQFINTLRNIYIYIYIYENKGAIKDYNSQNQ